MKKTLLLTHEYFPYHGGIARYCYSIFKHMPPDDFFVATDQKAHDPGAPVHQLPLVWHGMKPSWVRGFFSVRRFVRDHGIGIIVTPHILPLGTIAYYLHKFQGIPYVISLHGLDIRRALSRRRNHTIAILKAAQHIIVNSEATRLVLDGLGLTTPITVITPCFDPDTMKLDATAQQRFQEKYHGKKMILTVGRLVRRKGQDLVLRALSRIRARFPEVIYVMVGDGPDKQYFESIIADLNLGSMVEIHANVTDAELPSYYASASLFAMPSRRIGDDLEGFGIVYLEATNFGVPIVAGSSGGEVETVGERGALFFEGNDPHELAKAIIAVMDDPELASFLTAQARYHAAAAPSCRTQSTILQSVLS